MHTPIRFGGSGGSGSDDCTATAEDVLESKTAIYNGSDDEPVSGGMVDKSGTTQSATASLDTTNSRVQLTIPATGKYSTASKLYATYSTIRNLIGLTAAKIATGYTILGLDGTYKGLGDATAAQVLSGKKFSTASLSNATGTMTNVAATESAKSQTLSSGTLYVRMTNGAHITNASSGYPEVSIAQASLASTISLTAAKIKKGETILGITGTWEGYVASTNELYNNGVVGSLGGSIATYSANTDYVAITLDESCIVVRSYSSTTMTAGIVFNKAINLAAYSTITIKFTMVNTTSSSSTSLKICTYDAKPTDSSAYMDPTLSTDYMYLKNYGTSSNTVTLDISSISSSQYVGILIRSFSTFVLNITEITLS